MFSSTVSSPQKELQSALIPVQGRLNAESAIKLQQQLALIDPKQYSLWVLDLAQVEFIDSAGLGALVIGYKAALKQHCRLVLCNLRPDVRMALEISQLDSILEVVEGFTDLTSDQAPKGAMFSQPLTDRIAA